MRLLVKPFVKVNSNFTCNESSQLPGWPNATLTDSNCTLNIDAFVCIAIVMF